VPDGSFYFDNQPNMLDQFLINKNIAIGDAPIKAVNQDGFSDHFPISMTVIED